jgi:hypothetical protein
MFLSVKAGDEALVVCGSIAVRIIGLTLAQSKKRVNSPARKSATERRHETVHEEAKPIMIKSSANIMVNNLHKNRQYVKRPAANHSFNYFETV